MGFVVEMSRNLRPVWTPHGKEAQRGRRALPQGALIRGTSASSVIKLGLSAGKAVRGPCRYFHNFPGGNMAASSSRGSRSAVAPSLWSSGRRSYGLNY